MRRLWQRLLGRRNDDELREEIEFHLHMRAELNQLEGMSQPEARAAAHRRFGNTAMIQEDARRIYISGFRESLGQDLRYAFRGFLRTPGFTLTVVLILALGIGS